MLVGLVLVFSSPVFAISDGVSFGSRVFSSPAFAITAVRSASRGALVVSCWGLYALSLWLSSQQFGVFDLAGWGIALLSMTIVVGDARIYSFG